MMPPSLGGTTHYPSQVSSQASRLPEVDCVAPLPQPYPPLYRQLVVRTSPPARWSTCPGLASVAPGTSPRARPRPRPPESPFRGGRPWQGLTTPTPGGGQTVSIPPYTPLWFLESVSEPRAFGMVWSGQHTPVTALPRNINTVR